MAGRADMVLLLWTEGRCTINASKAIIELNTIVKETGGDTVGTVGNCRYSLCANVIPGTVEFTMMLGHLLKEN